MEKEKRIVSDREEIERKRAQDQEYLRNLLSKQYAVGLFGAVAVVSSIQAIQSVRFCIEIVGKFPSRF